MKLNNYLFLSLFIFCSLSALGFAAMQFKYLDQAKLEKKEMQQHLKNIASFQGQAISAWRKSRLWDGRQLQSEIQLVLATKSSSSFDVGILSEIKRRLAALMTSDHYISATLLDLKGNKLIEVSQNSSIDSEKAACILPNAEALNTQVQLAVVHKTGENRKHLCVFIPVVHGQLVMGSINLEIDPANYLYASSQLYMPHDVQVEYVLMQTEGEKFRLLPAEVDLPDVVVQEKKLLQQNPEYKELLNNPGTGSIEFTDRNSRQMIGYLMTIPDTPWFIVTSTSLDDVLAVLQGKRVNMLLLMVVFFGLTSLVIYSALKLQQSKVVARSEALLRAIIEQTEDGIILLNNQGQFKLVNPAFARMSGYSLEELMQYGGRLLQDENSDPEKKYLSGLQEKSLKKKNGEEYLVEINTSEIEVNDGQMTLGIIRDISETKRIEDELKLLQFAVDKSHESIFLINIWGDFSYVNQAACDALGYTRNELFLLKLSDIDPHFPVERWDTHWQEVQEMRQKIFESVYRRCDGSLFPVEIDVSYFSFKDQGYLFAFAQNISERKLAEQALAQKSDLLEAIFNDIPDAMALADADRRIIKVNSSFMKTFGVSKNEILGKVSRDFYADDADYIKQGEIRFHQTAEVQLAPYVVNYRRKNGEVFPGETIGAQVLDREGHFLGFIGLIRDITDRLHAEQAVRDSEAHYRAIFEQAQDAIVIGDLKTHRFIEFNEPAYKNLGYSREEFSQLIISDIEVSQTKNEIRDHLQNVLNNGQDAFETLHRTKRGEIKSQLVSIKRIKLGKSDRFISMWKDITELKQARIEVERFFNLSVDMFCIASLGGNFLRLSPAWSKTLGWSEQELLSKPWIEFVHEDDLSATENALEVMTGGQTVRYFENRYRTKQGKYLWLSWNSLPQQKEGVIYAVARDITDKKRLELELQQAHKMEAIGQLAGGIAHDFNNILATVLGFSHLARTRHDQLSTEKLIQYLDNILQAGNRGRDLVSQLMTFSRIQADEKPPVVNLPELVREVIRMLSSVLPSSIHLELDIDDEVPMVAINPVKFHQVLTNLCVNARDAMQGKGLLHINLTQVSLKDEVCSICHQSINDNWVMLSIRDTGAGMDSATINHIFDPFFTSKQAGEGSGMGLSVVQGIMIGAGGHIQVHSELEKGSEFRLLFHPERNKKEAESTTLDATLSERGAGQHILVVDDEPALVSYLKELLVNEGYRVTTTTDSREALDLIESKDMDFSLLISDQTMPHLTGIELASQLKQKKISIPVLICTGYSEFLDEKTLNLVGVSQLLIKPVQPHLLFQRVSSLLGPKINLNL